MDRVPSRAELEKLILKKQAERQESFAKYKDEHPLDEKAKEILALEDEELISQLQSRKLKCIQVLQAFLAKALEVNDRTNCVTEFIPQAKEWAENLDNLPEVKGPLHGIPIAIKEDHDVEGMDTTLGFAKRLYDPATESAVLVKCLKNLGAVPFAKTNIPQSLFAYCCDNPIFGATLHPSNPKMSPGGSSGGSGAMVGAGAALFATGSDSGGSLRIPAHFNGIVTLKATNQRLSSRGVVQSLPKLIGNTGVPGILAKNVNILNLVYKELLKENRQNDLDPRAVPIPWNNELFSSTSKLRIGYFTTLPFFPSIGDTPKVVASAKEALESLGHTVVSFEMPNDLHYMQVISAIVAADGRETFKEYFQNEPVADAVKDLVNSIYTPEWKQKLSFSFKSIVGQNKPNRAEQMGKTVFDARSSEKLWDYMWERELIIEDILKRMADDNLDLILSPAFPFPSIRVDDPKDLQVALVYTAIWNIADFPAGVMKFGTESGEDVQKYDDEGDPKLRLVRESMRDSTGMSIGVQLIARPFKEELVLRVMAELEAFQKESKHK